MPANLIWRGQRGRRMPRRFLQKRTPPLSSALAGISVAQLLLIAGTALIASIVGGVSGYGTGALMPLVLVPIIGPEPVVPILSISALLNNASRAFVFRHL